jgi:hypothetical protein
VRRALQRKCACGGACHSCGGGTAPSIVHRVLAESGRPLDRTTRAVMEPRFGHDFSSVRVHDGSRAAESAAAVAASAYTVGNHIVFGAAAQRDDVLAHELTHVVQQSGAASSGPLRIGDANDRLERDADAHAAHATAPRILQRKPAPAPADNEGTAKGNCGPDITKWFLATINAAKSDSRVQEVEHGLSVAEAAGILEGLSSMNAAEEELRDRAQDAATKTKASQPPPKNVQDQLSAAGKHPNPKRPWFSASMQSPGNFLAMAGTLYLAMTHWRDLVNHRAPFDFKCKELLKDRLDAHGCSDPCTNASVTIAGQCFRNDVPGNLFYAHVGRWVGLSENALQLGSIYAQLTTPDLERRGWDPPDDTQTISVGYNLPPLLMNEMTLGSQLASLTAREACTPCAKEYWPA